MDASILALDHLSFAAPALPVQPDPEPTPQPTPVAPPEGPKKPKRSGTLWGITLGVIAGAAIWALTQGVDVSGPVGPTLGVRTAVVAPGKLKKTLRVDGIMSARNYAAIRAPRMRGPRDAGRSSLTLMTLAPAGEQVAAGETVAEFELKWLEDHIDDVESRVVQAHSNIDKQKADNMVLRETDRQAVVIAEGEYEKAVLDLRTAEVRSEIEAEILAAMKDEAKVTAEELREEFKTREAVHESTVQQAAIGAQEEDLHLARHARDFGLMTVKSPIGGLIVMETMFKGGGSFQQTSEGDQVYPGSLFMRVVDTSDMVVSASINQVDIQNVRMGMLAEVRLDAYPDLVLEGRVTRVGAMAGSGSGGGRFTRGGSGNYLKTVSVEVSILATDERVIPDLSASADLVLIEEDADVLAPRESVRSQDGKHVVYVRNGEGFETREVQLGDSNDTHVVVESGLDKGEEVLLSDPPEETD